MRVILSPTALSDINHIYHRIALDNPSAARRLVVQIVATCDQLDSLPMRGRPDRVFRLISCTVLSLHGCGASGHGRLRQFMFPVLGLAYA